jgi:hypothetical protein
MSGLKRGDAAFLQEVLNSNGGGVELGHGDCRFVPKAREKRLINAGLIRDKPNHPGFVIHTPTTRAAIAAATGGAA